MHTYNIFYIFLSVHSLFPFAAQTASSFLDALFLLVLKLMVFCSFWYFLFWNEFQVNSHRVNAAKWLIYLCMQNWRKTQAKANKCDILSTSSIRGRKNITFSLQLIQLKWKKGILHVPLCKNIPTPLFQYHGFTKFLSLKVNFQKQNHVLCMNRLLISPAENQSSLTLILKYILQFLHTQWMSDPPSAALPEAVFCFFFPFSTGGVCHTLESTVVHKALSYLLNLCIAQTCTVAGSYNKPKLKAVAVNVIT